MILKKKPQKEKIFIGLYAIIIVLVLILGIPKTRLAFWQFIRPVARIMLYSNQAVSAYWQSFRSIGSLARDNNQLREENRRLLSEKMDRLELAEQNKEFRKLLNFQDSFAQMDMVSGRIIGRPVVGTLNKVIIDLGAKDGIKEGNAVVADNFLIGKVMTVGSDSSEVGLVAGNAIKIDVVMQGSKGMGVLTGGNNGITIEDVSKDTIVTPDDTIVTAGLTANLKAGIPVGTVGSVTSENSAIYQTISVKSPINFLSLTIIGVIK